MPRASMRAGVRGGPLRLISMRAANGRGGGRAARGPFEPLYDAVALALAALPAGVRLGPDLLPAAALDALAERAAELRRPSPLTVGEARRGEYADVLWRRYERGDLVAPALDAVWRRRLAEATGQLRAL